jgi:hypothetical protein
VNPRVLSAVGVLCWRWETYYKSCVLENDGKYNTVDPDGADVGPALQYRNRVRTFPSYGASRYLFVYLVDEPMHECRCESNENSEWDDKVRPRRSVQLLCEGPSDGVAVKRLNLQPAPDVVSHRVK